MSRLGAELVRGYLARARAEKSTPALEAALLEAFEAGRAAFPGVEVTPASFADHLARHAPKPSAIGALRHGELLLAAGCLAGDRVALGHFERLLKEIRPALERLGGGSALVEDVADQVRHLALAGKGQEPLLTTFAGRGPLAGWLQAAAVRTARNAPRPA
ncbi:MAG: hypothetical protein ACYC8T_35160, partial [Myxococcaceae bacterium]